MKACKPGQCPKCGSHHTKSTTGDSDPNPDVINNKYYWQMYCRACKTYYCEIYILTFNGSEYEDQASDECDGLIRVPPEKNPGGGSNG